MGRDHGVPRRLRRGRPPKGPRIVWRDGIAYAYVDRLIGRVTLDTRDPAEAARRFPGAVERARAEREVPAQAAPAAALAVIADAYLQAPHGWSKRNRRTTELRVLAFVAAMGERGVAAVDALTSEALDAWRKARMKTTARGTINRDEICARAMFAWARGQKPPLTAADPWQGRALLREPKRGLPPLIPSPREVAAVVAALLAAGERGGALTLAVLLATGLRLDELRHLRAAHVRDDAVDLTPEAGPAAEAWSSKSYRARRIPVTAGTARAAREFLAWRWGGRGGKGKPIGLADTWVADVIDRGRGDTDPAVPKFRAHDLRRTFATENVRAGKPITLVREWMGHRDVATTERYLGRYRDDAAVQAATSPALAVLTAEVANVVPIERGKKGS
jgi:integrase